MENNIYMKLFEVKSAGVKLQRDTKAFNYKYATLDQIQTKLGPVLEQQNLLVIHSITNNSVRTEIRDISSDEFVSSEIPMTEGTKPQDKGSEITYYRRYNLLSLLDLEVVDDDGASAQGSSRDLGEIIEDIRNTTDLDEVIKLKDEGKGIAKSDKQKQWLEREYKKVYTETIKNAPLPNTHEDEKKDLPF